jgi:hypothetical protein
LRPDWSIRQVFPSRSGLFETLEPEQELILPLCVELPADYDEGIDLIKFFATIEPADFHFLELSPLDVRATRSASTISQSSDHDEAQARGLAEDWNTRQFEIRVTR